MEFIRSQTLPPLPGKAQIDTKLSLEHILNKWEDTPVTKMTESSRSLTELPMELIQKIYHECSDIKSIVYLSATSRKFRAAYNGSQKLVILEKVLERQFGPLHDAVQVVTYNASQPAHIPRSPAMSMALAQQVATIGYVAQKWVSLYPLMRWRDQSEYRRTLRSHEGFRFRRAMYRIWLYGKAFHNSDYLEPVRALPRPHSRDERMTFLRRLHDDEIMELAELHDILHDMLYHDLCPSNAQIQQRANQGFPGQAPLYFGSYETYPAHLSYASPLQKVAHRMDFTRDIVGEAWGSRDVQYSLVRDILKLEPDELLHFREKLNNKTERVIYLTKLHESFHQNPSTLREAIEALSIERDYFINSFHGIDGGILDFLEENGCHGEQLDHADLVYKKLMEAESISRRAISISEDSDSETESDVGKDDVTDSSEELEDEVTDNTSEEEVNVNVCV
jgi:hypothetical protein